MRFTSKIASVAVALVASASAAVAQSVVTYSTTGSFSGAGCTSASCTFGGFTLSYDTMASTSYFAPSLVDLGSFITRASGTSSPATSIGAGATFTLTVTQTAPSAGTNTVVGSLSGSLAFNPSQSSLVFTPTNRAFSIGAANYTLVTDNSGNINIAAPTAATGSNPNATIIKANVTAVPEPSTYALLATGLVGTLAAARRRRSA